DNLFHQGTAPRRFEKRPCALNVGFKRRDGIAIGDADDGLRGQVENGVDFVFAEDAFERRLIAHVAADYFHALDVARSRGFRLRNQIAHQTHDVSARLEQSLDEPSADETGGAGDERWTVFPKAVVRHGARPGNY